MRTRARQRRGWSGQIRSWPGKVVPGNDRQVTAAVLTLIGNARRPRDQATELTAPFAPRYRAGWCNEAIVRMLDTDPDGTRQSASLPDPPVAGTTFPAWAERIRLVYGDEERRKPATHPAAA